MAIAHELTPDDLRTLEYSATAQTLSSIHVGLASRQTDQEMQPLYQRLAERIADALISRDLALLDHIIISIQGIKQLADPPPSAYLVLSTLQATASQGAQRRPNPITTIEPNSHHHKFLETIVQHPGAGTKLLLKALEVTAAPISRVGSRLEHDGLARRVRRGRETLWYPTQGGVELLHLLGRSD